MQLLLSPHWNKRFQLRWVPPAYAASYSTLRLSIDGAAETIAVQLTGIVQRPGYDIVEEPDGTLLILWSETKSTTDPLFVWESKDQGATWQARS